LAIADEIHPPTEELHRLLQHGDVPLDDQSAVSSVAGNQSMAKSRSNPPSRSVINWLWSRP
jgi:hypothetical protein